LKHTRNPADQRAGEWPNSRLEPSTTPLQEVRSAYDAQYRTTPLRDSDRFYRWMAERMLRSLPTTSGKPTRIADIGCGGGYLLRELLAKNDTVTGYGVEISSEALVEAHKQAPEALLSTAQGEHLPFREGTFDAVACLGNLEHFIHPGAGARELARICRPDGTVWILLPNEFYSGTLWKVITEGYGPNHHQLIDRFATVNEWRDFLEEEGLQVRKITPYNRFKWWKKLLPRNLAWHFLYECRPR
jgi:2-polyprenyl-3-methyl-5-hydroxy-6-metoxy-1,4-benzoquinol methylase